MAGARDSVRRRGPGLRAFVGVALLGASGAAYVLYGTGIWDPLPQELTEESARASAEDASGLFGIGRAPLGFSVDALSRPQTAAVSTTVAWRATGKTFVPQPAPERGYLVDEPRVWIAGRDPGADATEVSAPRGRFSSPVLPGPLTGELDGGVHLEQGHATLDTERATLTLPPAQGGVANVGGNVNPLQRFQLDRRVQRARLETTSPVRARFAGSSTSSISSGTLVLEAEGGASGDADFHRVVLRGPVRAADDLGTLSLEASDHVLVTMIRSRADLMASFDGLAGALGGKEPLIPAIGHGRTYELERIEAQGAVSLVWKRPATEDRPAVAVKVTADYLLADAARGVLIALGSPAVVEEKGRGQGIRGRVIFLRDRGENRFDFAALGGARLATTLVKVQGSIPRAWCLEGEEALGALTNVADPGDPPELDVLDAALWPRPGSRTRASSEDGRVESALDLLTVEKSRELDANGTEVAGPRDTVRAYGSGQPVWLWTRSPGAEAEPEGAGSWLSANEVELTEERGKADLLKVEGRVRGHLGGDVARMLQETRDEAAGSTPAAPDAASASPLAASGPWDVRGDRLEVDLWPKALDKDRELAWWEKSKVLRAHVEDSAELRGLLANGEPARVAGRAIDLDLVKGKLAVAPVTSGRVALEVAGTEVAARTIGGDLRSGRLDARGEVHARAQLPAGPGGVARTATLDAARASALIETDEARLKALRLEHARARREGRREVAPPPELLAFTAEGAAAERALVATSDGSQGEADRFEWNAATGRGLARARDDSPRVRLRSSRGEALAREAEVDVEAQPGGASYHVEMTGEVRLEGGDQEGSETVSVESDRARADATVRDEAGRPVVAWGPAVAWCTGERPVILASKPSAQPTSKRRVPPAEARGSVLRAFPGSRTLVLEAAPGESVWAAAGASWIEAMRRDPLALEQGTLGPAPTKQAMALRAPEATIVLEPTKPRKRAAEASQRAPGEGDEKSGTRNVAESLGRVRSLHAPGPLVLRCDAQTYEATALDYDGSRRCATLKGPGRVRGDGHTGTFQRATLILGDPDVNDR